MKSAMIWGAGGDIASQLIRQLNIKGWQVISISRNLEGNLPDTKHIEADPTSVNEVEQAILIASQETNQIDLWIYAAGDIEAKRISEMDVDSWLRILNANLTGAFISLQHSLPLMASEAHIVIIGAVSERLRLPGLSAYAASKAALEAFTDTLAKEERKKRVTLVRPGAVLTKFWDKVPMQPPKNASSAQEIAAAILQAHEDGHRGNLDL